MSKTMVEYFIERLNGTLSVSVIRDVAGVVGKMTFPTPMHVLSEVEKSGLRVAARTLVDKFVDGVTHRPYLCEVSDNNTEALINEMMVHYTGTDRGSLNLSLLHLNEVRPSANDTYKKFEAEIQVDKLPGVIKLANEEYNGEVDPCDFLGFQLNSILARMIWIDKIASV